jgi:hypothetical protein
MLFFLNPKEFRNTLYLSCKNFEQKIKKKEIISVERREGMALVVGYNYNEPIFRVNRNICL